MLNHKFRYASAKNFLCFGEDKVELFFENYGPIVVIKGNNKDTGSTNAPASNGSGKSSLLEIIVYTLFGKSIKKPKQLTHNRLIHAKAKGKGLETEVQFGDYRIVRKREPNSLRIWHSVDGDWSEKNEITRGTMKDTQELIDGIIGLSHQAFCNVVIFDDSKTYSFLESDTPTKRVIVENLLGLDQYRQYNETTKEMAKDAKNLVKLKTNEYEKLLIELNLCEQRVTKANEQEKTWQKTKVAEMTQLNESCKSKQEQLKNLDSNGELQKYQEAQERLITLQEEIKEAELKKTNIVKILDEAKEKIKKQKIKKDEVNEKLQEYNLNIKEIESNKEKSEKLLVNLDNLAEGAKCTSCHSVIDVKNYASVMEHEQHKVNDADQQIAKLQEAMTNQLTFFKKCQSDIATLEDLIKNAEGKIKLFDQKTSINIQETNKISQMQKPNLDAKQQVLESEIAELKKQLKNKREEFENSSPYKEIIESAIKEKDDKQLEIDTQTIELKEVEKELPYYDFWVKAFGDTGIRKFVVDGIIPALNSRISYWMQHLYEGQIVLEFDNELVETITRNNTEAYYHAMSNGEQQRINLAVSQSFAYVMVLNSGTCPSLVFLDEITGGGIDKSGINGVFNMICELSKERQVFITTHNEYLLNMLDGCETITVTKENDVTNIE